MILQSFLQSRAEEYALKGVAWCDYLKSHAIRLYSSALDPSVESAQELILHIKRKDIPNSFCSRDIYRKKWSKLTTPEEVKGAIQILFEYGWIKLDVNNLSKSNVYEVHPLLRKQA